jgi:hypothetical protein
VLGIEGVGIEGVGDLRCWGFKVLGIEGVG